MIIGRENEEESNRRENLDGFNKWRVKLSKTILIINQNSAEKDYIWFTIRKNNRGGLMMYCPKCKHEYHKGCYICMECGVSLVSTLPNEDVDDSSLEYVPVLATYNQADIAFIKSILYGSQIMYYFKGEEFNLARPLVQPAILMVRSDQAALAAELLKDFSLVYFGVTRQ